MKAVAISEFGPPEVLRVVELPDACAGPRVKCSSASKPPASIAPTSCSGSDESPATAGRSGTCRARGRRHHRSVGHACTGGVTATASARSSPVAATRNSASSRRRKRCQCHGACDRATTAAAIPETYFTVWTNLFERAGSRGRSRPDSRRHPAASGRRRFSWRGRLARGASRLPVRTPSAARASGSARRRSTTGRPDFVRPCSESTTAGASTSSSTSSAATIWPANLDCLALHGRLVQMGFSAAPTRRSICGRS